MHFPELLLHKESIGPSGHALPSGQSLGHGQLGLCNWHHSQAIQMSNSLLGPLMSELSCHLHFMSDFLKTSLLGCDYYLVASPGMYANQLVGIAFSDSSQDMPWPWVQLRQKIRHSVGLSRITDKLIPSIDWKKSFNRSSTQAWDSRDRLSWAVKIRTNTDCIAPVGTLLQQQGWELVILSEAP